LDNATDRQRFGRPNLGGVRQSGNGGPMHRSEDPAHPQQMDVMRFRAPNAMQANRFAPNNAANDAKYQNTVDEKLVPKQHVNYDKKIECVGLFSGEQAKCIPTAKIKIRSPWFSVISR